LLFLIHAPLFLIMANIFKSLTFLCFLIDLVILSFSELESML